MLSKFTLLPCFSDFRVKPRTLFSALFSYRSTNCVPATVMLTVLLHPPWSDWHMYTPVSDGMALRIVQLPVGMSLVSGRSWSVSESKCCGWLGSHRSARSYLIGRTGICPAGCSVWQLEMHDRYKKLQKSSLRWNNHRFSSGIRDCSLERRV